MRVQTVFRRVAAALACALSRWSAGPAAAADKPLRIVALGDLLTAGFGLAARTRFRPSCSRRSPPRASRSTISNAGVSGDTMSGGLARLDWSVPPETDAVILELGANDALRGLDPAVTRRALDAILGALARAQHPRAPVRHAGAAQPGRRLRARLRPDLSRARQDLRGGCSIRSSSTASQPMQSSTSATACIRPPPASMSLSRKSCPRSRS